MNINVIKYLKEKNWEYKETVNNEIMIKVCPFCNDDRNKFYISSENGLWQCKVCEETGNFYQLKAKMGDLKEIVSMKEITSHKYQPLDINFIDEFVENLNKDEKAYEYLLKRGFTKETIEFFKLGIEDGEWITIPHFKDKQLWNIKKRNYIKKAFKRITGQPSILFNIDNIDLTKKSVLIVEGETDCIASWQMGVKNVVALTTGAGTFSPEWLEWTKQFKTVYICLNNDTAGQKGAYKIAEKIGLKKCKNIILPTNDINDYLLEKTSEEFIKEFNNSKIFTIQDISSIAEYVNNLDEWYATDGSMSGLELPLPKLNNYLKGFKAEDLIILTGDSGVGKTTFTLNLLHHFLKNEKRCLGFFLEGKISYYILRMMSMESKIIVDDLNTSTEWENLKKKFLDYQMYFYSGPQLGLDTQKLSELLMTAVKLYDIDFVVIDNLNVFVKDDRYVVQNISQAVSTLKDLANDLKIPILLIAHIRKIEGKRKITKDDVKSSSTIYQIPDTFLILQNNKILERSDDDLYISVAKNRMGEGGLELPIIFEKEYATFREKIKEIDDNKKSEIISMDFKK